MKNYILHLNAPAQSWDDGTPLGNGSQGMMLWGCPSAEQITLNEETIWSGGPMNTCQAQYRDMIDHARRLYLEGREWEIDPYIENQGKDLFYRIKSYEYAGTLWGRFAGFDSAAVTEYRRDLDLISGKAVISFRKNGVRYAREAFSSHVSGLQCVRFTADESFDLLLEFTRECMDRLECRENWMVAHCHTAFGDNRFRVCVKVETDGTQAACADGLHITAAAEVVLYIGIFTGFRHDCLESASAAGMMKAAAGWDALLAEHTEDFSGIMKRSDIDFSPSAKTDLSLSSAASRLQALKDDANAEDPQLISLYYQFGKYLLVSSSREDSLPANLQGVWSEGMSSPWNADYHTNINLQMNYWHAEEAGLSESVRALFTYMNDYLLPGGKKVAAENYRARGMVVHHVSDIYGFAAAADGPWGMWPMGGAWLAFHMWEHYLYTGDKTFLQNTAYEYIRENALFFMDMLFDDGRGGLLSGPSTSPENRFFAADDKGDKHSAYITMSPTMDTEIIGGLLRFYKETEEILGIHPEDGKLAGDMADRLPPLSVGKHGQLMEWTKDYDEPEPGHRHVSHAFGLYPAAQITRATPELYKAIRVTMDRRLASGGGHTGWSRAWLINMFARLRDGENTMKNIRALFTRSTLPNLFDTHPPFQIDGNFGGAAGIGEMVMQSHEGFISLLPALDESLASGSFTGLCARGGFTVDASWDKGIVTAFAVTSADGKAIDVEIPVSDGTVYCSAEGTEYVVENSRIRLCGNASLTIAE
ncbi:MAG: glycoside hydrolase family 95 protein [Clostridia bacterium]|nr:glycoside hydrolase family 95 protein [Clostridia bacterium]